MMKLLHSLRNFVCAATLLAAIPACSCLVCPCSNPADEFSVRKIYGSDMVLQQDRPVVIAGFASAGKTVKVKAFGKTVTARADKNGEWSAEFAPKKAGGPYTIEISGSEKSKSVTLKNVMIGEVWFCAGQSNMEMPVWTPRPFWRTANAEWEAANANHPNIRLYNSIAMRRTAPRGPVADENGPGWVVCSPETVKGFSACGYFFGLNLQKELKVPVGLINVAWGGTRIEPWISCDAFRAAGRTEESKVIEMVRTSDDKSLNDIDRKMMSEGQKRIDEWFRNFSGEGAKDKARCAGYKDVSFNDSAWSRLPASGVIPSSNDGVFWIRKTINLPADWAGQPLNLHLGSVDDCDETFFNGVLIGKTDKTVPQYWSAKRIYTVPGSLVKSGKNVIAIRIADYFGEAGLTGKPNEIFLIDKKNAARKLALASDWKWTTEYAANLKKLGLRPSLPQPRTQSPQFPSTLFNASVAPWLKVPVRGVIWYQGCSNAGNPDYYPLHKILIADWRKQWNNPALPFLLVQLSAFELHSPAKPPKAPDYWKTLPPPQGVPSYALTREIQAEMVKIPNVGMAVSMDVGNPFDIHPRDKQTLGYRLSREALRIAYGKNIESRSPIYERMTVEPDGKIRIYFKNAESGLVTKDGKAPGAFAIAGVDNKYVWANAVIDGSTIVVSSPSVRNPKNVRYAFVQYRGDVNLMNKEGFPVSPFRTDKPDYR